jgi:hypothetical protein
VSYLDVNVIDISPCYGIDVLGYDCADRARSAYSHVRCAKRPQATDPPSAVQRGRAERDPLWRCFRLGGGCKSHSQLLAPDMMLTVWDDSRALSDGQIGVSGVTREAERYVQLVVSRRCPLY